jgi:hypothetical protein
MNNPKLKNRRISVLVLIAVLVGVLFSHVGYKNTENGLLLVVDAKEIDLIGDLNNRWTSLITPCDSVARLEVGDPDFQEALEALRQYSPPQSQKAKVASIWQMGNWMLVESEFEDLLPALVLLERVDNHPQIVPQALWSGYTIPFKAAPFIRQYIKKQSPNTPTQLLNCFKPQSASFQ